MASQSSCSMDNQLLRDVLNIIPEDDRGKLISLCLECIQKNNTNESIAFIASALPNVKVEVLATVIKYMTMDDSTLFRDVLVDTPAGDREKLISICSSSQWIPKRMDFIDTLVLISILSKMGCLIINDMDPRANDNDIEFVCDEEGLVNAVGVNFDSSCTCTCILDGDGRIAMLEFRRLRNGVFELPSIASRLQRLTFIRVYGAGSLSSEVLSNLPQLETLQLIYCSPDLFNNFPIQMKLRHLKKLLVSFFQIESVSSPFFTWMTSQLPSVEDIGFECAKDKKTANAILESFSSIEDVCFKDSLKVLSLKHCQGDENNLEIIMSKICPKFENLSKLGLHDNNIQSIHQTVNKIKNNDDAEFVPSKSLRILDLYRNPIFEKMKDSPEEKTAMLSFLQSCSSIHNIGGYKRSNYDSDIEHALRINHAGRSNIVKGDTDGSGDRRSLPLSMWPTVLVRAYEKSYQIYDMATTDGGDDGKEIRMDAIGVYDLIRNGLVGRRDWNRNEQQRQLP
jgi:hypothetical protein